MTTPGIDPRLVEALSADVAQLRGQLDRVSLGLNTLLTALAGDTSGSMPPAPPVGAPQSAPPTGPRPSAAPVGSPRSAPPAGPWPSAGPAGPWQPASPAGFGQPAPPVGARQPAPPAGPWHATQRQVDAGQARPPWWQRDGAVSKVLAIAGGVVTLIGVAMLVGLAIQAGWLGPQARVAGGGLLSAGLLVVAERLIGRPGGRVGALAIGATGITGLALTVVAMSDEGYGWVPRWAAAVLLAGVIAIGLTAAHRWNAQTMAVVTPLAAVVLTVPATRDDALVAAILLIMTQVAVLTVQLRRNWAAAHLMSVVSPLIALMIFSGADAPLHFVLGRALPLLSLLIAVVGATLTLRRAQPAPTAGLRHVAGVAVVVPLLPLLSRIGDEPVRTADVLLLGVLAVCAGLAASPLAARLLVPEVRVGLGVVAAATVLRLAFASDDYVPVELSLVLVAVVVLTICGWTGSAVGWLTGWGFGLIGLGMSIDRSSNGLNDVVQRDELGGTSVIVAVALIAAVIAGVTSLRRLHRRPVPADVADIAQVLIGLYAVTLLSVSVAVLIDPGESGWTVGHCVATVAAMVAAVACLQRGLTDRSNPRIWLIAGLGLAAMATVKLFLFDLAVLGGIPRAVAFLVVGLLLLAAGTRYARAFADRRSAERGEPDDDHGSSGPSAGGPPPMSPESRMGPPPRS